MTAALPEGWAWISVADLASAPQDITDGPFGSNLKTEHYTPAGPRVIRLQNIGDGVFLDEKAHIAPSHFVRLQKHAVKAGDVIVAMLGEHLPRACVAPPTLGLAIVKADCVRLRPDPALANSKFVCAGINSAAVRQQGDDLVHGVGRPRLGLKWFRTLRFPLAPLPEQERLVDAIDSYLTRLEDAVGSLERVQAKLKAYRASVLKAAVEGRLVPTEASLARAEKRDYERAERLLARILTERRRHWEGVELARLESAERAPKDDKWKEKYKEPAPPDASNLPELPEGWCWVRAEQVTSVITKGASPEWQGFRYVETGGIPFVRSQNVRWGRLNLDGLAHVESRFNEKEQKSILRSGDILLNIVGASIGRAAIVPQHLDGANTNQAIAILRPVGGVKPTWLSTAFVSPSVQTRIHSAKVDVARANLSLADAADLVIPLPPQREQDRILAEVDRCISVADAEEIVASTASLRITRLRQAVLKWAFEGKLADQDPSDEPADRLLARIRAERAVVAPEKKNRGRTVKEAA